MYWLGPSWLQLCEQLIAPLLEQGAVQEALAAAHPPDAVPAAAPPSLANVYAGATALTMAVARRDAVLVAALLAAGARAQERGGAALSQAVAPPLLPRCGIGAGGMPGCSALPQLVWQPLGIYLCPMP